MDYDAETDSSERPVLYELVPLAGSQNDPLVLTAAEFEALDAAKDRLVFTIGFEEKFTLLLENYAEYERTLLGLGVEKMIFADFGWTGGQDAIGTVNRTTANVLSAARSYLDQNSRDLGSAFGAQPALAQSFEAARHRQYDSVFGYRAMEAIRNYVQHKAFPVDQLSYPMEVAGEGEQAPIRVSVRPAVSVSELEKDKTFKRRVLEELRSKGDLIPLTPLLREYVQGLGSIHTGLRVALDASITEAAEIIRDALRRGVERFPKRDAFAAIRRLSGDTRNRDEVQLFPELLERCAKLRTKTNRIDTLARRYVSGRSEMPPSVGG